MISSLILISPCISSSYLFTIAFNDQINYDVLLKQLQTILLHAGRTVSISICQQISSTRRKQLLPLLSGIALWSFGFSAALLSAEKMCQDQRRTFIWLLESFIPAEGTVYSSVRPYRVLHCKAWKTISGEIQSCLLDTLTLFHSKILQRMCVSHSFWWDIPLSRCIPFNHIPYHQQVTNSVYFSWKLAADIETKRRIYVHIFSV